MVSLVYRQLLQTANPNLWPTQSASIVLEREPYPFPLQFIHGSADTVCNHLVSEAGHQWRIERNLPSELHLHPGASHGFLNKADSGETGKALQQIRSFLSDSNEKFRSRGCNLGT